MIDASARGAWRHLETTLRPFVARRVRADADVDDVLQEVFLRMHRGLGELRDDQRFGPWVYQVARSAIADHQRKSARHPVVSDNRIDEPTAEVSDNGDEGHGPSVVEPSSYIAAFVAMLPSPNREALTLTELQGLTQQEAATMLGISLSGMKSRVQRGRQQLRTSLEACCHFALDVRGGVISCEPRADGCMPTGCCE
jgi:RNA polymerase sigma-70 factor (ECF subfamily)